jgi:8-oxo-dGTP pyrophosphatase MutT (NUDIX family)
MGGYIALPGRGGSVARMPIGHGWGPARRRWRRGGRGKGGEAGLSIPPGPCQAERMQPFARHIAACNNIGSPAGLLAFRIAGQQVGWVGAELARWLAFRPQHFHFDAAGVSLAAALRGQARRDAALEEAAKGLEKAGFLRLRDEAFDIRATPEGPVLGCLDRGALPAFGIMSQGVHVNGLVRRPDGLHLWMGWRARDKSVAPGQLDNVVAGGIPAGLGPAETLVKEAGEEAGLPPELARQARPVGRVAYTMATPEGLRRDVLHCYDLEMPEGVVPAPHDDEVERFELLPIAEVMRIVAETDQVKFNVNLVLIDLFLREGLLADPDGTLRAGLDQGP